MNVVIVVGPAFSVFADTMVACESFSAVRLSQLRAGAACNEGVTVSPAINSGASTEPLIRMFLP